MSGILKSGMYVISVPNGGNSYEMKMLTFSEVLDWLKDDTISIEHKRLMLDENPELKIYYEG